MSSSGKRGTLLVLVLIGAMAFGYVFFGTVIDGVKAAWHGGSAAAFAVGHWHVWLVLMLLSLAYAGVYALAGAGSLVSAGGRYSGPAFTGRSLKIALVAAVVCAGLLVLSAFLAAAGNG